MLDWIVTSYFLIVAGATWGSNNRAAATALVNAGMVGGLIAATDYDGDGRKPLSFEDHGKMDLVQAGVAATLPVVLGFAGSAAYIPFQAQAMNELLVVSATDWEAADGSRYEDEDIAA